jgi:hypothetical protein
MVGKRTYRYTAYGTQRWAEAADLPHMLELEGNGLSVGLLDGKPSKIAGIKALFNSRLRAKQAWRQFIQAFQKKPPKPLVGSVLN